MKLRLSNDASFNLHVVMQRAGYHFFRDPVIGKESYVMRISRALYPRYHVYVTEYNGERLLDLHIDQKKASYEGHRAHSGDYEGPRVEEEMNRLQQWVNYFQRK